jgi:LmbE family N-acetylglucosaminyl deacetylase
MSRASPKAAIALTALLVLAGGVAFDRGWQARRPDPPSLSVGADTRLLVFAPHPDDEVLAAGGVIQQVRQAGGSVRVVYITSGDSYTESVKLEQHVGRPTGANYRAYGHQREFEARAAMRTLGVGVWSLTFLGFPNGGLDGLMSTYWSERRAAYRSPFTRQRRPAQSESFIPDTEYRGEDLTQELAEIIGDFKPSIMLVPRPEDQHPDHCATWFFVADALGDVMRVKPRFHTDLVNYIVHYNSWGVEDDDPVLMPPDDLDGGASGWMSVALTDGEVTAKRAAVHKY